MEDLEELKGYLFYASVQCIQKIDAPENRRLKNILLMEDGDGQVAAFQEYLSDGECLKKFLQIFPVVATTCISAHRLGRPEPYFDMTVMDEASQCNIAVGLVPVIRGRNLGGPPAAKPGDLAGRGRQPSSAEKIWRIPGV